jgi:hypothetical protein
MKFELIRDTFTEHSTIGSLLIDGEHFSYTLEDTDRQRLADGSIIPWAGELKVPGETAIPYGTYQVIINRSKRFKSLMPLLLNVPDFEGVRIHTGNTAENVEGCVLIGYTKAKNFVGDSRADFLAFFDLLSEALKSGKVYIKIRSN